MAEVNRLDEIKQRVNRVRAAQAAFTRPCARLAQAELEARKVLQDHAVDDLEWLMGRVEAIAEVARMKEQGR